MSSYIDGRLGVLAPTVGEDLLLLAEHWGGMDDDARITLAEDWRNDMHELEGLEGNHARGEMDASQEERYLKIKADLAKHLPVVRRLGLTMPSVPLGPLNEARASAS